MRIVNRSPWLMSLLLLVLLSDALEAQTPPSETTSKVKRVLLFNYIMPGQYICPCRGKTVDVFLQLGTAKGFSVDTASSFSSLTLDNLKRYQVLVWNNTMGGIYDSLAREAVSEYVRQGGGWMLVNIANYHMSNWPFLTNLIGPGTSGWTGNNFGMLVSDTTARNHPELRHFVMALPDSIPLQTNWLRMNPARMDRMEHVKIIYRVKNAAWVDEAADWSQVDHYIWSATHDRGKTLSLPLGWESSQFPEIMTQADSAVPRLYWQGLRWLAGDYQGGCTNPAMANFNPEARVDDGSCTALGIRPDRGHARILVGVTGRRMRFSSPVSAGSRMRVIDLRGQTAWTSTARKTTLEFDLPEGLPAGLYFLEATGKTISLKARILVP